jgi:hypothetical protein
MPNLPNMPDLFGKNYAKVDEETPVTSEQQDERKEGETTTEAPKTTEATAVVVEEPNLEEKILSGVEEEVGEKVGVMNQLNLDAHKAYDQAAELGSNIGGQAKEIGSNFGNMIFSFGKNASSSVFSQASRLKDVIEEKTIIGDFNKENEKFVNDKKLKERREEAALPPWVGYAEEEMLKEQITELSTDSRNFLRQPPDGVDFNFDFNIAYPVAMVTLEEDVNLKEMRFKLVPVKISEENFWRNYFYRVSLIKQSCQLETLNNNKSSENSEKIYAVSPSDSTEKLNEDRSSSNRNQDNEFVSDSYDPENLNVDEIKSDLKQLNLDNKKMDDDDTEWDKELTEDLNSISAEELEKEINQMIGKD